MSDTAVDTTPESVRDWLIERVAFYLETPAGDIHPDARFVELGLDSVYALTLCGDIEERYDLAVEPTLAWDYPTVHALAGYLHAEINRA